MQGHWKVFHIGGSEFYEIGRRVNWTGFDLKLNYETVYF